MLVLPSVTHGGTTFGHWGGANCPPYSAMCSSYDYDAPISEAGWATPKYHKLRELLIQYADSGQVIPDVPAPKLLIEIAPIQFTEVAPLFSNLPKPQESEDIHPMEYFDQGWGTILYRTTLPEAVAEGTLLFIDEAHDWTQIYADGKLLPRQKWTIDYADSESTSWGNYSADKIYDLQESTFWCTERRATFPHAVVINLGEECKVGGFRYLPRAEEGTPGAIKGYKAYVKQEAFKK